MSATKWPKWDRYEWDARLTAETDMSETLETEFRPIWLRQETHRWHWYDWDAQKKFIVIFYPTLLDSFVNCFSKTFNTYGSFPNRYHRYFSKNKIWSFKVTSTIPFLGLIKHFLKFVKDIIVIFPKKIHRYFLSYIARFLCQLFSKTFNVYGSFPQE